MKASNAQKLRDLSVEELSKEVEGLKVKLFGLKCQQVVGGGIADSSKIRGYRREIARMLTIIGEKNRSK